MARGLVDGEQPQQKMKLFVEIQQNLCVQELADIRKFYLFLMYCKIILFLRDCGLNKEVFLCKTVENNPVMSNPNIIFFISDF